MIEKIFSHPYTICFQGPFLKIILGTDTLLVRASCRCNLGERDPVRPLLRSRCTTLVGSIGEALETITFQVFFRPHNGDFWTVATIYHNLQRM